MNSVLFIISTVFARISALECTHSDISLTQKIEKEGFHRELLWLLELEKHHENCTFAIRLEMNKETFVNPDQIADLNRMNQLSAYIEGDVDVEAVSHLATPHKIYIFIPKNSRKVSLNVPFHLRYQRAQISGGYSKAIVNKPTILAKCDHVCSNANVEAVCDVHAKEKCVWKNVTYQALFDETELLVPVGDLDDYPLVSIVTLLLGCAGCIYTLSVLSTTPL